MRLTAPIVVDTKDGHRALDPRSLNSVWELKVMGAKNIMGSLAAIDAFAAMEALRPYGIAWLMGQNPWQAEATFGSTVAFYLCLIITLTIAAIVVVAVRRGRKLNPQSTTR